MEKSIPRALSLSFLTCAISGLLAITASAQTPRQPAKTSPSKDYQVLEMVLRDLITYDGIDKPLSVGPAPREVFFNPEPYRSGLAGVLEPLRRQKIWERMSGQERAVAQEAAEHLAKRTDTKDTFKLYRAQDSRIHVSTKRREPDKNARYFARYPVQAWAPGYSSDGTYAVVQLFFPELLHPSIGTYVLQKQDEKWKVLFCAFVTYL
jgi:hypothetical protein